MKGLRKPDADKTLAKKISSDLAFYENTRPRNTQVRLGHSSLGGCRELIRSAVEGKVSLVKDVKEAPMPAMIGTAFGAYVESIYGEVVEARSEVEVTTTLPTTGIQVTGHCDLLLPDAVWDFKMKNGLAVVRQDGASLENLVQISSYFLGLVQAGELTQNDKAVLVYFDRSGVEKVPETVTLTFEDAMEYIAIAEERLADVQRAIALGEKAPRDPEESFCWYISCPVYDQCWPAGPPPNGYMPNNELTNPHHIQWAETYMKGRAMKKEAESLINNAKANLRGVYGRTETFSLNWKVKTDSAGDVISETIDLREL